jgi:ankyrin repeat protein
MKKRLYGFVILLAAIAAPAGFADIAGLMDAVRTQNEVKLDFELRMKYTTDLNALVDGKTALMLASEEGWQRGVEMLLEARADTNVKGSGGITALMLAAGPADNAMITKLLLGRDANANTRDDSGNTVLMYAVTNNSSPAIFNLLLSYPMINLAQINKAGEDALIVAARENNREAVAMLLRKNAKHLDRVSSDGKTALMWACENDNAEMVRTLIELGRINMHQEMAVQGAQESLPVLLWAIQTNKSYNVIAQLLAYYTDPLAEIVDRDGNNAMHYAILRKDTRVIRLLQQNGIY